ncbi:MAG: tRNA lysidine(34) synthetase TilS [Bacillota bacterium]
MIEQVRDSIESYQLLSQHERVLVSVSGGPDSLALLHMLWRLKSEYNLSLHVFHLDHMFRGKESAADAQFVAEVADKLGIAATIKKYDVPSYAAKEGLSKQVAARQIRYRLANQLAEQIGADKIAIGQHADDQAETVMLNFLRGAGLDGLSGIEPIRDEKFIRPLLEVWRKEIESYCAEHDLQPRIDSSNLKPVYRRNQIRLELIPYLEEEFNESIKDNLHRMADLLRAENNFLTRYAHQKYKVAVISSTADELVLNNNQLKSLDLAICRRVLRRAIAKFTGSKRDYYAEHIKQLRELMESNKTGKVIQLPDKLRVRKDYEKLKFYWAGDKLTTDQFVAATYQVPGIYHCEKLGIRLELEVVEVDNYTAAQQLIKEADKFCLDQELVGGQVQVRQRKAGDYFQPLGMDGHKKVKDFLIDEKIDPEIRDWLPIFTTNTGDIFAVGQLRIDERFKVTAETTKVLTLGFQKV